MVSCQAIFATPAEICNVVDDATKDKINLESIKNDKSKENMQKWLNGNFALETYKVNYLLPYGYSTRKYASRAPTVEYENYEAELQVSLKFKIGKQQQLQ
jgi:hypothetical protein